MLLFLDDLFYTFCYPKTKNFPLIQPNSKLRKTFVIQRSTYTLFYISNGFFQLNPSVA